MDRLRAGRSCGRGAAWRHQRGSRSRRIPWALVRALRCGGGLFAQVLERSGIQREYPERQSHASGAPARSGAFVLRRGSRILNLDGAPPLRIPMHDGHFLPEMPLGAAPIRELDLLLRSQLEYVRHTGPVSRLWKGVAGHAVPRVHVLVETSRMVSRSA